MDYFIRHYSQTALYNGYSRAIALDFSSRMIFFFDPDVVRIILENEELPITELECKSPDVEECIENLVQKGIAFKTAHPECFPKMSYGEYTYAQIENLSIDFSKKNIKYLDTLIALVNYAEAKAIKINFLECNRNEIEKILYAFTKTNLHSIECVLNYKTHKVDSEYIKEIQVVNQMITRVSVIDLPRSLQISANIEVILYDNIYPKLVPDFKVYTESQKYHTYFNKKIHIGISGEIKSSKESSDIYGNLETINGIEGSWELILSKGIDKFWTASKDKCLVCKDCDLRHVCIDNRIPYRSKIGEWYHKDECSYNPYICKWKGEQGYRTLKDSGVTVTEGGCKIDSKILNEVNESLWG